MKNRDSILRIKQFSDSEDDEIEAEGNEEQPDDEVNSNQSEDEEMEVENSEHEENSEDEDEVQESMKKKQVKPSTSGMKAKAKIRKKGIIYISSIPQHMNVAICREMMEQFGEVGRIFLQPDSKGMTKKANKKKRNVNFTEGWVEFEKKKVAKWVAEHINTTSMSSKKGTKFYGMLWSFKYLPGFKWIHLSERLTYERAVQHQKLQIATSKARKEANFFQNNLDKSEFLKKKKKAIKVDE